jgi:hypothetical protein
MCPDLSKSFPMDVSYNSSTESKIAGEVDFYLNGSLRWGIELLVNGDRIGEHLSRFEPPNGKYVSLGVQDYAVVDIRMCNNQVPKIISKHEKRITVFFKKNEDYKVAHCIFGTSNDTIEVQLSN